MRHTGSLQAYRIGHLNLLHMSAWLCICQHTSGEPSSQRSQSCLLQAARGQDVPALGSRCTCQR